LTGSGSLVLANSASAGITTSIGNNGLSTTYSGIISGSGTLIKVGQGLLALSGSNPFSGGITVAGGTLQFGNGGANGSIGSSTITDNAVLAFNRSNSPLKMSVDMDILSASLTAGGKDDGAG
jgi:autotransporter-associated beta strand protein